MQFAIFQIQGTIGLNAPRKTRTGRVVTLLKLMVLVVVVKRRYILVRNDQARSSGSNSVVESVVIHEG